MCRYNCTSVDAVIIALTAAPQCRAQRRPLVAGSAGWSPAASLARPQQLTSVSRWRLTSAPSRGSPSTRGAAASMATRTGTQWPALWYPVDTCSNQHARNWLDINLETWTEENMKTLGTWITVPCFEWPFKTARVSGSKTIRLHVSEASVPAPGPGWRVWLDVGRAAGANGGAGARPPPRPGQWWVRTLAWRRGLHCLRGLIFLNISISSKLRTFNILIPTFYAFQWPMLFHGFPD